MREILDNNLPRNYRNELISKEYNIYEQPLSRTIDQLEAAEPALKAATAAAKEMNYLKGKVQGGRKACKRTHDGNKKVTTGEKKQCKHCGKKHAGECWDKKKNGGQGNAYGSDSNFLKKETTYIKQMIEKQMIRSAKADSNSESNDNGLDWTQGLNSVQQMFIAQEFKKNNSYDSDNVVTHIDPDELISLKKKCKKMEKQLKSAEKYTPCRGPVLKEEKSKGIVYRTEQPTIL